MCLICFFQLSSEDKKKITTAINSQKSKKLKVYWPQPIERNEQIDDDDEVNLEDIIRELEEDC